MFTLVESCQGENYGVHRQYVNPVLARALQMSGYNIMCNKGEACYLSDVNGERCAYFLGGRGVFGLGRSHIDVDHVIHETLGLSTPNMVQMDRPLLSGLLREAPVERIAQRPPETSLQRGVCRTARSEGK